MDGTLLVLVSAPDERRARGTAMDAATENKSDWWSTLYTGDSELDTMLAEDGTVSSVCLLDEFVSGDEQFPLFMLNAQTGELAEDSMTLIPINRDLDQDTWPDTICDWLDAYREEEPPEGMKKYLVLLGFDFKEKYK